MVGCRAQRVLGTYTESQLMFRPRLVTAAAALALALGGAAVATPALAQSCPVGDNCTGNVSGTVTIPTSLTLTLAPSGGNTATSFSIDTTAGGTAEVGDPASYSQTYIPGGGAPPNGGGAPVKATVMTNDPGGYTIGQAITSANGDFEGSHGAGGNDVIPATSVSQLTYGANQAPTPPTWAPFAAGGALSQISSNDVATNGDVYYLGYQVAAPGTTDADTYSATFTVTALAE